MTTNKDTIEVPELYAWEVTFFRACETDGKFTHNASRKDIVIVNNEAEMLAIADLRREPEYTYEDANTTKPDKSHPWVYASEEWVYNTKLLGKINVVPMLTFQLEEDE